MSSLAATDLIVVDADSHVTEPADLWTSRIPKKFADVVPRVELYPESGLQHWVVGSTFVWPVGFFARAGRPDYVYDLPGRYEDMDPGAFDPVERLKRMDEYGIDIQILYPNLLGFQAPLVAALGPELSILCTKAYNDFILEWSATDPNRLIPIAMLPYWDLDASVAELQRCANLGHRGVLFANKFEKIGLPSFCDPYWDILYNTAQDLEIPINYHVGFSSPESSERTRAESLAAQYSDDDSEFRAEYARGAAALFLTLADVVGRLVTSGLCERFPRLKFVSVESGFGYIAWYLEALDWQWRAYGNRSELLPSEYFRRQCYGTFWFEETTLDLLKYFPDNFMFSTDYPHATSLSPGPASPADLPSIHIDRAFANIDPDIAAKAISGNAFNLYKLDALIAKR